MRGKFHPKISTNSLDMLERLILLLCTIPLLFIPCLAIHTRAINMHIAASIVHSKLDYCNSFYYNFPKSQINRLQQMQNCLAHTVVKAPKSSHSTPILRSLH